MGGFSLSHLFFADDAIIFCKATKDETMEVMGVLQCYAKGSGKLLIGTRVQFSLVQNVRGTGERKLLIVQTLMGVKTLESIYG